jgi:hypothetical protein
MNQIMYLHDRGADNPHRNIIMKPVREAKARLWAVVPLMMMMMMHLQTEMLKFFIYYLFKHQ